MTEVDNENELREQEIDTQREAFESSCRGIVADLTGWGDENWNAFNYDEVEYLNAWTNACWQSYIKGWKSRN
jgi:alpha-glucosidase (family GH31 glycosyl hydrolase)